MVAIIEKFRRLQRWISCSLGTPTNIRTKRTVLAACKQAGFERGQVAQVVERSPEKAGVGGSTPSLATMFSITHGNFLDLS